MIGGGITGLVATYRLLQKNYQMLSLKKVIVWSGLLGGFKINNIYLERLITIF